MKNGLAERKLLAAVMERALRDVMGELRDLPTSHRTRAQSDARRWISRNGNGLFSFRWCTQALDLDPGTIRKKIREGRINLSTLTKVEDPDRAADMGEQRVEE